MPHLSWHSRLAHAIVGQPFDQHDKEPLRGELHGRGAHAT